MKKQNRKSAVHGLKRQLSAILAFVFVLSSFIISPLAMPDTTDLANGIAIFDTQESMSLLGLNQQVTVTYDANDTCADITCVAGSDPFIAKYFANDGIRLSADTYKYVVITYKIPTSCAATAAGGGQLFYAAGDSPDISAGNFINLSYTADGLYGSVTADMSNNAKWKGQLYALRFDVFNTVTAASELSLDSIILAKDAEEAEHIGAYRTAIANHLLPPVFDITVDFDTADELAKIGAGAYSVMRGDVNGDGAINMADVLIMRLYMVGKTVITNRDTADANNDGRLNTSDLLRIRRVIGGYTDALTIDFSAYDTALLASGGARLTSTNTGTTPAFVTVDVSDREVDVRAYNYAVVTMMSETGAAATGANVQWMMSNGTKLNGGTAVMTGDGRYISTVLAIPSDDILTVDGVRITPVGADGTLAAGESVVLEEIMFCESDTYADEYASLHMRYHNISALPATQTLMFDNAASVSRFSAENNLAASYNAGEMAATLTASSGDDPHINLDLSNIDADLTADIYKYVTLTYRVPASASASATQIEVFFCAGNTLYPTAGCSKTVAVTRDGAYHALTINLAGETWWNGDIHALRIDAFVSTTAGDSIILDSVAISRTRVGALVAGDARVSARTGRTPGAIWDSDQAGAAVNVNGTPKTLHMAGASSVSVNQATGVATAEFTGSMIMAFDGLVADGFNRFTLGYTANTYMKATVYYVIDGVEMSDLFYLERGSTLTFSALINKYFDKKCATEISLIEFAPITTSNATVRLTYVSTEIAPMYDYTTHYYNNGVYKLGFRLDMGGGISYLERLNDGSDAYGNLLNDYDTGRLVQQSYYGIKDSPYVPGYWNGSKWVYNPVQGGDSHNVASRIIDFEMDSAHVYVKAQPMDWAKNNSILPCYMENVYTMTTQYVKVENRFVDFSGYTHAAGWQELPAFYTISALNNFVFHNGSSPWTGEALIRRGDLPFWGEYQDQCSFALNSTSEQWSAWVDNNDYGVGLYVPCVYSYHAGKFGYNGSTDPGNPATNYVAPRKIMTLKVGKPLTYSYLLTIGSVSEIRSTIAANRGIINNSALTTY